MTIGHIRGDAGDEQTCNADRLTVDDRADSAAVDGSLAALAAARPGLGRTFASEIGPYFLFLFVYLGAGLFWATGVFMAAAALSVVYSTRETGRLPTFAVISTGLVLLFGGLTLILGEATFIKIKPTVSNLFFAAVLGIGLPFGKYPIRRAFGHHIDIGEARWFRLTLHIALFLAGLAALNEFVRLSFSTDVWVFFKVFGLLPLNLVFAWTQYRWIRRSLEPAASSPAGSRRRKEPADRPRRSGTG